jgi:hypothetical protein
VYEFFCPKLDDPLSTVMYKSVIHTVLTDRERHTHRDRCALRERERERERERDRDTQG